MPGVLKARQLEAAAPAAFGAEPECAREGEQEAWAAALVVWRPVAQGDGYAEIGRWREASNRVKISCRIANRLTTKYWPTPSTQRKARIANTLFMVPSQSLSTENGHCKPPDRAIVSRLRD